MATNPMDAELAIFTGPPKDGNSLRGITEAFKRRWGTNAAFIARAPGRVNVIGEHIDYAQFGCLPAAIDRTVLMACKVQPATSGTSRVQIANTQSDRFPSAKFEWDPKDSDSLKVTKDAQNWTNYFKAGIKSVLSQLPAEVAHQALDFLVLVDGNVPPGGGLSSSAAMVVASALTTIEGYGSATSFTNGKLASLTLEIEALVGVNSGGMDQCASILSEENALLNVYALILWMYIREKTLNQAISEFFPRLKASVVKFPITEPALSYVICNTLVTSEKQKTAKFNYNLRIKVVEQRVAAQLLATHLNVKTDVKLPTLKQVMEAHFHKPAHDVEEEIRRLDEMLRVVETLFGTNKKDMEWEDVYSSLGNLDKQSFIRMFHPDFEIEADKLRLYMRAKHAFGEAKRVFQYRFLMEAADEKADTLPKELGKLMNESQSSCNELYECSCEAIEEVCRIARGVESYGSRLTGAGWGGCTVHLIAKENEGQLIDALKSRYFSKRFPDLSEQELCEALFATTPQKGACLYRLESS